MALNETVLFKDLFCACDPIFWTWPVWTCPESPERMITRGFLPCSRGKSSTQLCNGNICVSLVGGGRAYLIDSNNIVYHVLSTYFFQAVLSSEIISNQYTS